MTWVRGIVVTALAVTGLAVVTAQPAAADGEATLSAVTCAEEQGSLTLTLTADDASDTEFFYDAHGDVFSGDTYDEEYVVVPAGESKAITLADLDDGEQRVEVLTGEEGEEFAQILDEKVQVACDAAPEGPYTNARATIQQGCGLGVDLYAANRPVGGNVEDLQPAAFVFTLEQGGTTTELAGFTLPDEVEDPYTHTLRIDLGNFGVTEPDQPGDFEEPGTDEPTSDGRSAEDDAIFLVVTANGTEIRREPFYFCEVVESSSGAGGGPAVVNTGA